MNNHLLFLPTALALAWRLAGAEPAVTNVPPEARSLGVLSMTAAIKVKVAPLEQKLVPALARRDYETAEKICRQMIAEAPFYPNGHYNLACLMAIKGQPDEAFKALEAATGCGFNSPDHIERDADLASLRDDKRFQQILARARLARPLFARVNTAPAVPTNGVAWVSDANTVVAQGGLFRADFKVDTKAAAARPITTWNHEAAALLRQWWTNGTAAGNAGDLYDNRDNDHSNLGPKLFPQLTYIEYGPEAKALNLHWGLADQMFLSGNGAVVGNASVAATSSTFWRSMSRAAYTTPQALGMLQAQYFGNQIYLYPCHHDHSPGRDGKLPDGKAGGHGDVFPANTPYLITSQGSSGSDQPFIQAVVATLAAFQPEVKKFLAERGALMPVVQYIFRVSNKTVVKPDDYLTGAAHPPVFDSKNLDAKKMVTLAHEITLDKLPPLVLLKVEEEDKPEPGRDFFEPVPGEELFTTSGAIARVMRSTQYRRKMVVSALPSRDLNNRPLKYRFVVLRGDPQEIWIKPLNAEGSRVEISAPWHPRRPVAPGAELESNRIEIGAFVHNGAHYSPPAFITWYCPDSEVRFYDSQARIKSVTYTDPAEKGHYADPQVVPAKNWRDEYHYDAQHQRTGWTRWRGEQKEEFDATGALITRRDVNGKVVETKPVRYVYRNRGPTQAPVLEQVTGK